MAFEIDYLPVGEGDKAGDCIALRFWDDQVGPASQKVIVIDGGFKENGESLVEHINDFYGTNKVDLVILTHPDRDHSSGLTVVLEKMEVECMLMHRPWEYAQEIKNKFKHPRITSGGIESSLEASLRHASEIEDICLAKKIPIFEPYSGTTGFDNKLHVLGPDLNYYKELIPHFRGTPQPAKPLGALGMLQNIGKEAVQWVSDNLHINLFRDDDTTSAENNSSAVILFEIEGHKLLLTGDVGITGLNRAIQYGKSKNILLTDLLLFDVPHHGSKRNIGKSVMEQINAINAYISAPKDSEKHPAKKVTNHLIKKGMKVHTTQGKIISYRLNTPNRLGWGPAPEVQFYALVEN